MDRFYITVSYGTFWVMDRNNNKKVVGYHKKEFAAKTANGLNKENPENINNIISSLKTISGYGQFIN